MLSKLLIESHRIAVTRISIKSPLIPLFKRGKQAFISLFSKEGLGEILKMLSKTISKKFILDRCGYKPEPATEISALK